MGKIEASHSRILLPQQKLLKKGARSSYRPFPPQLLCAPSPRWGSPSLASAMRLWELLALRGFLPFAPDTFKHV